MSSRHKFLQNVMYDTAVRKYHNSIVIVIVILFTFHKSNVGYNPVDTDIVPYYTKHAIIYNVSDKLNIKTTKNIL
jgi:hypothetical protein